MFRKEMEPQSSLLPCHALSSFGKIQDGSTSNLGVAVALRSTPYGPRVRPAGSPSRYVGIFIRMSVVLVVFIFIIHFVLFFMPYGTLRVYLNGGYDVIHDWFDRFRCVFTISFGFPLECKLDLEVALKSGLHVSGI